MKILIIGKSKASENLKAYLKHRGIRFTHIPYRKTDRYIRKIKDAEIIFILTKDSEIERFYNHYKDILYNKKLFHFSGSVYHPQIISMHPIFAFRKKIKSSKTFEKIIFTSERPFEVKKLLPWLKNRILKIRPDMKIYYHAILSIYFNFPLIIKKQTENEIRRFGISKKYLDFVFLKNIEDALKTGEITGPIARNDKKTIELHLSVLKGSKFYKLYKAVLDLWRFISKDRRTDGQRNGKEG